MTNGSTSSDSEYPLSWDVINALEMYYLPILVLIGSIGNFLSVIVIFATKLRRTSSSLYLAALAVSDTGFLVFIILAWLEIIDIYLINEDGLCQFFVYWPYVCSFLSAWFVVGFTIERYVAVCYPLRRQWMCTLYRAKGIIIVTTFVGLFVCSPVLIYTRLRPFKDPNSNVTRNFCQIDEDWEYVASLVNYCDTIVTFALPLLVIIVLNTMIVKTVRRVDRARSGLKEARNTTIVNEFAPSSSSSSSSSPLIVHQAKVTKMLLVVSSVFFCFNLPAYLMRVYAYLKLGSPATELEVIIQKFCNLLFDTNFGISFILYCSSGQNFRAAVKQLFGCRKKRTRQQQQQKQREQEHEKKQHEQREHQRFNETFNKKSSSTSSSVTNQTNFRRGTAKTNRTSGSTSSDERTTIGDKTEKFSSFEMLRLSDRSSKIGSSSAIEKAEVTEIEE